MTGDTATPEAALLRWTGQPLVDMGVATLMAFAGRARPEDVAPQDLDRFADYLQDALTTKAVQSHASELP
jgi:hypothetical protein